MLGSSIFCLPGTLLAAAHPQQDAALVAAGLLLAGALLPEALRPSLTLLSRPARLSVLAALLRGRFGATISPHPAEQLLFLAALFALAALQWRGGLPFWLAPFLALVLLQAALLDLRLLLLPDSLSAALAAAGMVLAWSAERLPDALLGAAAGWLLLTGIAVAWRRLRGREGLGAGDAKLLGAIGCWAGWQALPVAMLAAALLAIVATLVLALLGSRKKRVPFGLYLALSLWMLACLT